MKLVKPKLKSKMPSMNIGKPPKVFRDTDGDLTPNMIDCEPRNPRKQGVVSWLKEKAQSADSKLKEYASPEARQQRYENRLERVQQKTKLAEAKAKLTSVRTGEMKQKLGVQQQRVRLSQQRQQLVTQRQKAIPSGFGSSPFGGKQGAYAVPTLSVATPSPGLGEAPKVRKATKRRKKKKKSKTIIIRTG